MIRREHRSPILIAFTGVLLLVCYASTLGGMIRQWSTDKDMGHGFLVPVVISWIVWRERRRWRQLDIEPSLWGFALLAAGAGLHAAGATSSITPNRLNADAAPAEG
jgi:Transmembrane exosortase (Exosortase_EpsH)